jgi:hypothetical protein
MNITLPQTLVTKLEKATANKSAFIARAVVDRLAAIKKDARRQKLLEAYRYVAKHPEYENDTRDDW